MEKEIWKDIPGYKGKQVSNLGRVRSLNYRGTGKPGILKPHINHNGYLVVGLGHTKTCRINRLVWEAFNGPIPEGMQVNHINEDKTDNRLENLNLMTPKENNNWGTRLQKLSLWVIKLSKDNEILHFYPSVSQAARENGMSHSQISKCCRGKMKTSHGFIWKYAQTTQIPLN